MKLRSRIEFLKESLDKFFDDVHEGDYKCSSKDLTSLVELNIPSTINGYFYCSSNNLTNLIGGPEVVNGGFYCGDNKLTSLEGCPREVNGGFVCGYNKLLKNLDFLPQINGELYIRDCPLITKEMIEEVKRSGKVKDKIISDYGTKK